MNIYELYEESIEDLQPFVDLIIDSLNSLIQTNFNDDKVLFFYDTTPITNDLNVIQSNRIADSVIKYYRERGIRISISNNEVKEMIENVMLHTQPSSLLLNGYSFYYFMNTGFPTYVINNNYNYVSRRNYIFQIRLDIRLGNEYMKSYC